MTGYVLDANAAYTSLAASGGNMTPAMPASTAGKLLLLESGVNTISATAPDLTASGFIKLSPNVNAPSTALYGKIGVGGDGSPTFQWDGTHQAWSRITAWSGNVYTDLSTIVVVSSDRGTNATGKIAVLSTLAPNLDNCLVIRGGQCLKTATNNGSTFQDWFTDSGLFTKVGNTELVQNGNALATALWYWQQTSQTATSSDVAGLTNADTNANTQGFTVVLQSQNPGAIPPQPVLARRRQFFVDETLVLIP